MADKIDRITSLSTCHCPRQPQWRRLIYRTLTLTVFVTLMTAGVALAQDQALEDKDAQDENKSKTSEAKQLSGMSIVGNDEAPKSLYIVPWKSSEIGVETSLHMMLNENDGPVDRDVFMRQLDFYNVSRSSTR